MTNVPPARLAEIVPSRWAETRRRVAAVRRLLGEPDRSTRVIMRYADDLGVSRQMIYKLMELVRAWDAAADRPAAPPRWRSRDEGSSTAVRDALAGSDAGAPAETILARAREIARAREVTAPTRHQVYAAMGRSGAGTALGARLGIGCGLLLDAAPLAVSVASDGSRRPTVLTAACDADLGGLAAWTLTDGRADGAVVARLLAALETSPPRPTMATAAVRTIPGAPDLPPPPGRVRAGAALKAAIGATVGRIRLLPQTGPSQDVVVPEVSKTDLRIVLEEMLGSPDAVADPTA